MGTNSNKVYESKELPSFKGVQQAAEQISPYVHKTPIFESKRLNDWLGHRVLFKAECMQKVGAFKARGALNALLQIINGQKKNSSIRVVTNSSGNHAQAVAWAGQQLGIPVTVFMPKTVSTIKRRATESYGAEVVLLGSRAEVDSAVEVAAKETGVIWIPPYNHLDVIHGQGTAMLEAMQQTSEASVDAVFAPCGGGGLLSGTITALGQVPKRPLVFGVEPKLGDDAAQSLVKGSIVRLEDSPKTLADGARTLAVGDITFECLRSLDGFYTANETSLLYWTQWLSHLLKLKIEPTSAMTMAGVTKWLDAQSSPRTVLVILSGGNVDVQMMRDLNQYDFLDIEPKLNQLVEVNGLVRKRLDQNRSDGTTLPNDWNITADEVLFQKK